MNKRTYILLLLLLFFKTTYSSIDPPNLKCTSTAENGNVTLSWIVPTDINSIFDSYLIYFSQNEAGPYSLIATIDTYTQNTFVNNATTASGFYYIISRSDAPDYEYSIPSDTLQTISLFVSNPMNGTAVLDWSYPTSNNNAEFTILRKFPLGTWTEIGTSTQNHFIDTIQICNSQIDYKIEVQTDGFCTSSSNISGNIFQNLIPPSTPILDSVSLNQTSQNAILGWNASSSSDTKGYIIYEFVGNIWTPIDTVWGIDNTFYENVNSDAPNTPESYSIAAIDSCGITSPITNSHKTVLLNISYDLCSDLLSLNWTPYQGFDINYQEIFISKNNGQFESIAIVPASENNFSLQDFENNSTYKIFIKAISSSSTSSSNIKEFEVHKPNLPDYIYLRYASVNDNGNIDLAWIVDETAIVNSYILQKLNDDAINWTDIQTFSYEAERNYFYTDTQTNSNQKPQTYRISVIDSCGNAAMTSNTAQTIFLTATAEADLHNTITWTAYSNWLGNVSSYSIYRYDPNSNEMINIETLSNNIFSFSDAINTADASNSEWTYKIMAIENSGNPYNFTDTAWSNAAKIKQFPRIFIPNAFSPQGRNKIFAPVGLFIDNNSYSLKIFNRFGKLIFSSNDFSEGWDGMSDGEEAPIGIYTYTINFLDSEENPVTYRGSVTLIR